MELLATTTGITFYHEDEPNCIYTRDLAGVIHWEDYVSDDSGETMEAGDSQGYSDNVVASFLKSGTWVLVETTDED